MASLCCVTFQFRPDPCENKDLVHSVVNQRVTIPIMLKPLVPGTLWCDKIHEENGEVVMSFRYKIAEESLIQKQAEGEGVR